MIAVRLSSSLKAACSIASQIDPSAISESPHRTQTRYGSLSSRLPASATPTPMGSPWPRLPVATSTQGMTGVGWPCSRLPCCRKVSISSSLMAPAALYIEYSSGEA